MMPPQEPDFLMVFRFSYLKSPPSPQSKPGLELQTLRGFRCVLEGYRLVCHFAVRLKSNKFIMFPQNKEQNKNTLITRIF